jgi:hypothetical protein
MLTEARDILPEAQALLAHGAQIHIHSQKQHRPFLPLGRSANEMSATQLRSTEVLGSVRAQSGPPSAICPRLGEMPLHGQLAPGG